MSLFKFLLFVFAYIAGLYLSPEWSGVKEIIGGILLIIGAMGVGYYTKQIKEWSK